MTFMSWRKDYEVGVPQIDAEHRRLFDLINEFHDTFTQVDARKQIAQMLNRLVAYAEEHFQHEEQLMGDSGYPQLDMHRELHSGLVSSIFAINERLAADTAKASTETVQFLKNWLLQHILKHDVDIAEFLQRKANQAGKANPDAAAAAGSKAEAPAGSAETPDQGQAG
jgi:hemerythrin